MTVPEIEPLNGKRKAAILLVLLGDEAATGVYKLLPEEQLRQITQEIAEMEYISPEVAARVLDEYHKLSLTQEYVAQGGQDYASKLLVKAFGEQGARGLLDEVSRAR